MDNKEIHLKIKERVKEIDELKAADRSDVLAKIALDPKSVLEQIPKAKRKAALSNIFPLLIEMSEILQKYKEQNEPKTTQQIEIAKPKIVNSDPESTNDEIED